MSEIDLQARPALAPSARLQTDRLTGEPVLLYPEGILELNATSHAIVERCDGQTTVEEICAGLAEAYEVEAAELREDVLECLRDLRRHQLIVW
jgi:coenzyme PQQ biosynthesis protein PqqD